MNMESIGLQSFAAGMSVDRKYGTRGQFYYSKHVDFRKNPGQFSVLPAGTAVDDADITDLVVGMEQVTSGKRYAVGDTGKMYEISTGGVWSTPGTIGENSGYGIAYRADVDHLYATGQTGLARLKFVSGSATWQNAATFFTSGTTTFSGCYKTGGTNTYTTPTSVSETATAKREFTSDIEPFIKIGIKIVAKGTGNWTVTLHDDGNTALASKTIANASLTNGAINYFEFSAPVRAKVDPAALTYHFHVTSTVADGTVQTTTASSLADCDMELYANALVTPNNGLHPIINFINYTLIGNGNYVAAYEPLQDSPTTSDFDRHRLTLPTGYEVCGFANRNQYAVIAAEKRSTAGDYQEGALFFWDGISETYNDWWPVPEGSPESLFAEKNVVYYIAGGALYRLQGMEQPVKVRTFRSTDSEYSGVSDSTRVYPNCMTVRRGVLLAAYPSVTTNTALEQGVYSLGSVSREYPESFGFSYTASHGDLFNTGSKDLRIGMIKNFGDTLYISWRNDDEGQAYNVDVINNDSSPASTFTLESLYFDNMQPFKPKRAGKLIATFDELPANTTITLKYKIDRASSWTNLTINQQGTYAIGDINQQFFGIEFGIEGSGYSTTPIIRSLYLLYDPLKNERELG